MYALISRIDFILQFSLLHQIKHGPSVNPHIETPLWAIVLRTKTTEINCLMISIILTIILCETLTNLDNFEYERASMFLVKQIIIFVMDHETIHWNYSGWKILGQCPFRECRRKENESIKKRKESCCRIYQIFLVWKMSFLCYCWSTSTNKLLFSLAHLMTLCLSHLHNTHIHELNHLDYITWFLLCFTHMYARETERARRISFFLHVSYYAKARILNLSYFHFGCRFLPHILWLCSRSFSFSLF